jgi:hypothetical protein
MRFLTIRDEHSPVFLYIQDAATLLITRLEPLVLFAFGVHRDHVLSTF